MRGKFLKALGSVPWERNLNLILVEAVEECWGPRSLVLLPSVVASTSL